MGNIFDTIFVIPILNVLIAIYLLLQAVGIPYALGFAIILLTVVIRLLLYPFTTSQLMTSKKMQKLSPHLAAVKEKHKGDPRRLQQETLALYKEHGINPAAGCLPTLIQLPIIFGLWTVLTRAVHTTSVAELNKMIYAPSMHLSSLWNTDFFGVPLGKNPSELLQSVGVFMLLVPIITAALQYIQSRQMFAKPKVDAPKKQESDFATAFQTQSMYIFPIMIGYFSYTFPIGLSLYWNTFSLFGIIQSLLLSRNEKVQQSLAHEQPKKKGRKK
jgi:YidC/Oxa1 family membrane protein insertase